MHKRNSLTVPKQTKKQTIKQIGLLSLLIGFLGVFSYVSAQDLTTLTAQQIQSDPQTSSEIENLSKEIDDRKSQLDEVNQKKEELEEQLNIIQRETYSIKNQISAFDNRIQDTEFEIQKKTLEIEKTKLEIERLAELLEIKKLEIEKTKIRLSSLIRIIDEQDRESPLYVLFSRDSFSSYLEDIQSAAGLQIQVQDEVKELKTAQEDLDTQKIEQEEKTNELEESKDSLQRNQETLNQQRSYQETLYQQSTDREVPFEELISQIQREEDSATAQVRALENAVREKLFELNKGLISNKNVPLAWPLIVSGLNSSTCAAEISCTATFMDPGYRSYFGRNHYAVDVPVPQGSPVYAPADGYVTGLIPGYAGSGGLSVLSIQHTDDEGLITDMKTRYLHMSSFLVSYDPNNPHFIRQGDVIGYSGGTCGTPGAGTCYIHTTGPHLHFEVWIGASVVNPLTYLP